MASPKISILVPNYRTRELTTLCLDLLKKYTDPSLARVIVIDNDSKDESLEYLRSLDWIKLVTRTATRGEPAHVAHAKALDLAFREVDTEYVLSIHTDTLALRDDWLNFLLRPMSDSSVAGVGSWKLEHRPLFRRALKTLERNSKLGLYTLIGKQNHTIEGTKHNPYYLRSHCALFRTDLIRSHNLGFADNNENACKVICLELEKAGYRLVYIRRNELIRYIEHVDHATMFLNPEEFLASGELRKRHIKRGRARLARITARLEL